MKELTDIFSSIGDLYTKKGELAAIWLEKPVKTAEGRQARICTDCLVWVQDGKLIDGEGEPTHKVISTHGTLVNQFEIKCSDLKTGEVISLRL